MTRVASAARCWSAESTRLGKQHRGLRKIRDRHFCPADKIHQKLFVPDKNSLLCAKWISDRGCPRPSFSVPIIQRRTRSTVSKVEQTNAAPQTNPAAQSNAAQAKHHHEGGQEGRHVRRRRRLQGHWRTWTGTF